MIHHMTSDRIAITAAAIALFFFAMLAYIGGKFRRPALFLFGTWAAIIMMIILILIFGGFFKD